LFLDLGYCPDAGLRFLAAPPDPRWPGGARLVKHLLLRESQGQPLLVVFEDLHWIDAETQALLDGEGQLAGCPVTKG